MKLIVGNFKMNLNNSEIEEYIKFFKREDCKNVIYAPSNIYLTRFIENGFKVASQDVSFSKNGAFTGDVSASQLKSIGVRYSIVGHSERRKYYNDDCFINDKLKMLLEEKIFPILCIGETKEEKEQNETIKILKNEIDSAFKKIDNRLLDNVIIAYEPIWSIGTGIIPTNLDIEKTITEIKNYVKSNYLIDIKVLYGGSVNNDCIDYLESISNIDGYLVGGCSIKKEEFLKLIKKVG